MKKELWKDPRRIDEDRPVMASDGKFTGIMSRGLLIAGLLGYN